MDAKVQPAIDEPATRMVGPAYAPVGSRTARPARGSENYHFKPMNTMAPMPSKTKTASISQV